MEILLYFEVDFLPLKSCLFAHCCDPLVLLVDHPVKVLFKMLLHIEIISLNFFNDLAIVFRYLA